MEICKRQTIIKTISRISLLRKKESEETFVFEFDADIERSIAGSAGCGSANPRTANNPRPKNPPSKKEIYRDRPSTPVVGMVRGVEPLRARPTLAKSGSLAWRHDFKKRSARRPAYSINAPRPRAGWSAVSRKREPEGGKAGHL